MKKSILSIAAATALLFMFTGCEQKAEEQVKKKVGIEKPIISKDLKQETKPVVAIDAEPVALPLKKPEEKTVPKLMKVDTVSPQKKEIKLVVDKETGKKYDPVQYTGSSEKGEEPKWNYSKQKIAPIKKGASTVTYQKCVGCHGANGMKKAFGRSDKVAEMSHKNIVKVLKKYRDKKISKYGHGSVMYVQVKNMSDLDFTSLANQIKSLEQIEEPENKKK